MSRIIAVLILPDLLLQICVCLVNIMTLPATVFCWFCDFVDALVNRFTCQVFMSSFLLFWLLIWSQLYICCNLRRQRWQDFNSVPCGRFPFLHAQMSSPSVCSTYSRYVCLIRTAREGLIVCKKACFYWMSHNISSWICCTSSCWQMQFIFKVCYIYALFSWLFLCKI